jgi:hypothetical protein
MIFVLSMAFLLRKSFGRKGSSRRIYRREAASALIYRILLIRFTVKKRHDEPGQNFVQAAKGCAKERKPFPHDIHA